MPSLASYLAQVYHGYILELQGAIRATLDNPKEPENLHKVRTTTRRIRTLLKVFKKSFDPSFLERASSFFKGIIERSNEARDIDVFLLHFNSYRSSLPSSMREWIEPLRDYLQKRQEVVYGELLRHFGSEEFLGELHALYFARVRSGKCKAKKGIKRALKRLRKRLHKVRDLHRLRIIYKQIRYVTELLAPFEKVKKEIRRLKKVQDLLGSYHDKVVQRENVYIFVRQSQPRYETVLAAGKLMGDLEEEIAKLEKTIKRKDLV